MSTLFTISAYITRRTDDGAAALEPDPQDRWPAYDEYWRKVHGPKVRHRDGPDDDLTGTFVRYAQQHRIPGGPRSGWTPPYLADVDADGLLVTDPMDRIPHIPQPRFDGIAQLTFTSREALAAFMTGPKYTEKVAPDERAFLSDRYIFTVAEDEEIVEVSRAAPILLVKQHRRNPDLTRAQFRARWRGAHADLVLAAESTARYLRGYRQLHTVNPDDAPLYDPEGDLTDGITMMSFASPNDLEDFLTDPTTRPVLEDEVEFCAQTDFFTALTYRTYDAD